jgi:phosphatidylglycerophosphate synthase
VTPVVSTKATDAAAVSVTLAPDLERFSRRQSLYAFAGLFAALSLRDARALVLASVLSFAALLLGRRGAFTSSGRFGAANAVTLLRLVLVLALAVVFHGGAGEVWAGVLVAVLSLDALDGYLARRSGDASAFGSHFDMETDALIVLLAGLELVLRERVGPWVLVGGALRYLYVIVLWCLPSDLGEHPRSSFGRWAFFGSFVGLTVPFVLEGPLGTAFAVVGTLMVSASFGISFMHWAEGRRRFTARRAHAAVAEPRDPPR